MPGRVAEAGWPQRALWRAVDQDGTVLDILVQSRRDQHAAERFLHRVLDAEDGVQPRVIVTDNLASYVPAVKRAVPHADHRRHKRLNNRAENSHRPGAQARASDAAIQVAGAGAAISRDLQRGMQSLPSTAAQALSWALPPGHARAISAVAGDRPSDGDRVTEPANGQPPRRRRLVSDRPERSHVPMRDRLRDSRGVKRTETGQRFLEGFKAVRHLRRGGSPGAGHLVRGPSRQARSGGGGGDPRHRS
jgi:transposase-like protein